MTVFLREISYLCVGSCGALLEEPTCPVFHYFIDSSTDIFFF